MTTMLEELDELVAKGGPKPKPKPNKQICINAGHGWGNTNKCVYDPGAIGVGAGTGDKFEEAELTLRYARTLRKSLKASGLPVFMTRTSCGDSVPLEKRARMAVDAGCGRFVSIHLNAFKDAKAHGVTVLYRDDTKDKPLAENLQKALVAVTGLRDRGTSKRTDLAVLKFTPGPAVLIELGFITNEDDRNFLLDGVNRESICAAIAGVLI